MVLTISEVFKELGGSLSELVADYGAIGAVIVLGLMTSVQIIPSIKCKPWSWLARKIGKAINGEVLEKVSALEKQVEGIKAEQVAAKEAEDERNAKSARTRILRFGDEVRNQQRHTKEHFDDILQDISDYETFCDSRPHFENDKARLTIEHIKAVYRERLTKNDFL